MKVLVACEFSGIVREAFKARGHDAWSCDLLPTEIPGQHIQGDVSPILKEPWDLAIAHPPCTYLTLTGNKWFLPKFASRFPDRHVRREAAVSFFMECYNANADMVVVENPIGIMSSRFRKPDQIIHPWHFGDEASKATCLWLRGLFPLSVVAPLFREPQIVGRGEFVEFKSGKRMAKWYCDAARSGNRAAVRSKTFLGIAAAMAEQWG